MVQDERLEWGVFADWWQHQLFGGKADLLSIVEARGGGTEKKRLMTRVWKIGEPKQSCRREGLEERPDSCEVLGWGR